MTAKTRNGKEPKPGEGVQAMRARAKKAAPPGSKEKTGEKRKKQIDAKAPRKASVEPGADLLEGAADALVSENARELAQGLMKAAIKGNASCAKMLVTLTERVRIQKKAVKEKKGPTAAQLAASEPDWPQALKEGAEAEAGCAGEEAKPQ